ncbi:helix-turn-helix domain-containing protein [Brevibacillus fluminis]|uniref:helix-turn-helix domain-containing protein n=1 Tax=Brevibacillus fluminis TaxID=511487 RepID=UPI003F89EB61
MSKIAQLVGNRIRFFRKGSGLSQEQLAFKAGLNPSYLGQVERGEKSPTIDSLEKIATALDVTLEDLFSFEYERSLKSSDSTFIDKIAIQLHGRSQMEQEAVYNFIKQLLLFRDKK